MGLLANSVLALPDLVMIYLLIIMYAAARFGHGPSIAATGVSVLAYYFYFSPPARALTHLLTCLLMLLMGFITGNLVYNLRREERESRTRANWATVLFALSRDLGSAVSLEGVAGIATRHAREVFGGEAAILVPRPDGSGVEPLGDYVPWTSEELAQASETLQPAPTESLDPRAAEASPWRFFPLVAGKTPVGVFALSQAGLSRLNIEKKRHVVNFLRLVALALERVALVDEAEAATVRARTEEMRSSLLSAVSHDLRTPLAAITGAATTLRERPERLSDPDRRELLETICEEAEHLERLVANLLEMTRLEAGAAPLQREWVPLDELLGGALYRLDHRLARRQVNIEIPESLPLISADPVLLEQVFYNLFDNAGKYSPEGSPIDVNARMSDSRVTITVADRGRGLPPGNERNVFEKFYRGPHSGVQGAGLGLAICRAIVEAHEGTITAEQRPGGGALFRLELPLSAESPQVIPEESTS